MHCTIRQVYYMYSVELVHVYVQIMLTHMYICSSVCCPLPSNQSLYRQIASYQRGVGDHRVG